MFTLPDNARPYPNCFIVNVTPELASTWIAKNNFNRPLKPHLVCDYVRDIESGNWHRTHQGIAFDNDGVVLDGQHRLYAIIRTGRTVPMLVFLGENADFHKMIDRGVTRSMLDIVRLELKDNTIKGKHLTVLKAMIAGRFCKCMHHLTSAEMTMFFRRYGATVRTAVDILGETADTTLLAVVARAVLNIPQEKLLEFCNLIHTSNTDHLMSEAVTNLLGWMNRLGDRRESTRREIYKRTQGLLMAFLNGEPTWENYRESKDYFPLYANSSK